MTKKVNADEKREEKGRGFDRGKGGRHNVGCKMKCKRNVVKRRYPKRETHQESHDEGRG